MPEPKNQKYEYVFWTPKNWSDAEKELNDLGRGGWEIACSLPTNTIILKRKI